VREGVRQGGKEGGEDGVREGVSCHKRVKPPGNMFIFVNMLTCYMLHVSMFPAATSRGS